MQSVLVVYNGSLKLEKNSIFSSYWVRLQIANGSKQ